jgi:hypothetical protein
VFLSHGQRSRYEAGQQLEHRVGIETVPTADRLGGFQGATAGEHRQPGQQPLFGLGKQLEGPVDRGPERLVMCHCAAPASSKHSEASF